MSSPDSPPTNVIRLIDFRLFQMLFRDLKVGALIADLQGRIQQATPAVEALLGWPPAELTGRNLTEMLSCGQRALDPRVLVSGEAVDASAYGQHQDGRWLPVRLTVSVLRDDGGETQGLVALLADDSQAYRERTRLSSLIRLGTALNAEHELPALLERILCDARELFQVDAVHLSRLDEQTRLVLPMLQFGPGAAPDRVQPVSLDQTDAAIVEAILERHPVIRQSPEAHGHDIDCRARVGLHSHLVVPLLRGEQVLGAFSLIDTQRYGRFNDADTAVASTYAELAAVALEDARLHEATHRQNERLQALARVNQLLTVSLERTSVFSAIASGAKEILEADEVRVWLLSGPEGPFQLAHFQSDSTTDQPREVDYWSSRLGDTVRRGQPWQTPDIQVERRYLLRSSARARGMRACLSVPLMVLGHPIGALTMLSRKVKRFDQEELDLAISFANQAAIAVQNAETVERERQARWLDDLLERPDGLPASTRRDVEHLISIAEQLIDGCEGAVAASPSEPAAHPVGKLNINATL